MFQARLYTSNYILYSIRALVKLKIGEVQKRRVIKILVITRLRVREGFRKTSTWNRANTFFAKFPWRYVMIVKFSIRAEPFSVGSVSFCLWSRADGFVSAHRPTARPHYAECR